MLEVAGVTVTAILVGAVTAMAAAANLVESATEVAVSVSVPEGIDAGAMYVTLAPDKLVAGETVPQVLAVQAAPDSAQLTPLFWLSFVTIAEGRCTTNRDSRGRLGEGHRYC